MNKAKIFYILFIFFILEITSRAFLAYRMEVPFLKPGEIIYKVYPQLKVLEESKLKDRSDYYDILFLGASTLHKKWGNIEEVLQRKLKDRSGRKIRIFNLATPAFTFLDNYFMYNRLRNKRFDLVLLYGAINELRANNCPPAVFKDDYAHFSWYEDVRIIQAHKEINFLTLPYSLHMLSSKIFIKYTQFHVPTNRPKKEWVKYGCDIKTKDSFKKNTTKILEIASGKKEAVLLMTFAFYVPDDYSLQKFHDKLLDYGSHGSSVEIWGRPDCVVKGIKAHNEVIKEIALRHPEALFIDQEKLIPKSGLYFNDICHLTGKGCEKFVDNILETILAQIS